MTKDRSESYDSFFKGDGRGREQVVVRYSRPFADQEPPEPENIDSADSDHIAAGHEVASRLGLLDEEPVPIVSLGQDEHGREQVLVIGGQTIRLAVTDGSSDPLELHRTTIRSVSVLPEQGLHLVARKGQWLHQVPDTDANYLRDAIINLDLMPPRGKGGQCIPEQDWRHEQLANIVGRIVMRAAEAEHNLSLVAAYGRHPGGFDRGAFGQSGKDLIGRLKRIGQSSPAVAELAERYDLWSDLRNQLVHSVRPTEANGRPGPTTNRPIQLKRDTPPEILYAVETQDLPELVDLWYAFNWLYHDALDAYRDLSAGIELKDLPVPNSVPPADRLPHKNT